MPFILEETLRAGDLTDDLKPHLVYGQVVEGFRKPTVFTSLITVDTSLVGKDGTKISVPTATQLSATTITESNLDNNGYEASDKTMSDVDITIGSEVYCATMLSNILMEDKPSIDWVRLMLTNMGAAVREYEDGAVRDTMLAGVGTTAAAATGGTLDFDDVVDGVATMKAAHLYPDPNAQFILVCHPNNAKDIVKDTRFYDTKRYAIGGIPFPVGEVGGLTAGCRVVETSNMIPNLALIVAPPNHKYAPFVVHAIKRPLSVKSWDDVTKARTLRVASTRYGSAVVQSGGLYLISNC